MLSHAKVMVIVMTNYRVQVFEGPQAGVKSFPTLEAAMAHRDWLRANNVPDYEIRIGSVDHLLFPQTEPNIRTAGARILGEADATVWQKVRGLNAADCPFY